MKKKYNKPSFEIEYYSLDASIASNCEYIVTAGPQVEHHQACEEYVGIFDDVFDDVWGSDGSTTGGTVSNGFYQDTKSCNCYYTASGDGTWTS